MWYITSHNALYRKTKIALLAKKGDFVRPIYESRKVDLYFSRATGLTALKHPHPHIELVLMPEGEAEVYADNRGGVLRIGHAFIAFPNQAHHYADHHGSIKVRLFIFSPDLHPSFYAAFAKSSGPIQSSRLIHPFGGGGRIVHSMIILHDFQREITMFQTFCKKRLTLA